MATIIDELVTVLGVDIAPHVMPKIQKFNSVIDSVTRYVGWASAGLMGAATSVAYFTERMAEGSAEMMKFGQITGTSPRALQELGFAAEQSGGSFDALQQDLLSLTKTMSSPIPGEFHHGLFMLGVSVKKASGEVKSADEVLMGIADKFEGMSKIDQIQWASRIGISDDTLMLLRRGRAEIERLRKQAEDIPTIVDEQSLKDAQDFIIQLKMVHRIFQYIGQEATSAAGPALKGIVSDFTEWLKLNRELLQLGLQNVVDGIVDGFSRFGHLISDIGMWLSQTIPWVQEFIRSLSDADGISSVVFGILVALAGVLVIIGAEFAVVTAAIIAAVAIFEDFVTFLRGGDSLIGSFIDKIGELANKFNQKFPHIGQMLRELAGLLKDFAAITFDALLSGLGKAWDSVQSLGKSIGGIIETMLKGLDRLAGWAGFSAPSSQASPISGPVMQSSHGPGNTIQITQNISGDNAPAVASESSRKVGQALHQTFPGGLVPVTN